LPAFGTLLVVNINVGICILKYPIQFVGFLVHQPQIITDKLKSYELVCKLSVHAKALQVYDYVTVL